MTTTDIAGTEKIAVAQDGGSVSPHFGHCESYAIFQIENGTAVRLEDMENPGHEPGKLPLHLAGTGITTVLAGGIGQRALAHLQENGVTVIRSVSGDVNAAAVAYAAGTLVSGEDSCGCHGDGEHHGHHHHHGNGSCGCHEEGEHHHHMHHHGHGSCGCHGHSE